MYDLFSFCVCCHFCFFFFICLLYMLYSRFPTILSFPFVGRTCPPLVLSEHANVSPVACQNGVNFYQDQCTLHCDKGYRLVGNSSHTCRETGQWSDADDGHFCEGENSCEIDPLRGPPLLGSNFEMCAHLS